MRCGKKLDLEILKKDDEIQEGFLSCTNCHLNFPIVGTVPILWDDFAIYLTNRPRLGGDLYTKASSAKLKAYIKKSLGKIKKTRTDLSVVEKRWASIYEKNKTSQFYRMIKKSIGRTSGVALEHGCSIGIMTSHLAESCQHVFGIDKSYYAIEIAKKSAADNLDYFVADSLLHPFGKTKFDCVLGLNLLEIIEPADLLGVLVGQVKKHGTLVLSDPYDFERGERSIKEPMYAQDIRKLVTKNNLAISARTRKPSFYPWRLNLHERARLEYKVDLVIAKKFT